MQEKSELSTYSENHQESVTRFILFWGEMASRWGINKTMAQIHALLYVSEEPLDTDEYYADSSHQPRECEYEPTVLD